MADKAEKGQVRSGWMRKPASVYCVLACTIPVGLSAGSGCRLGEARSQRDTPCLGRGCSGSRCRQAAGKLQARVMLATDGQMHSLPHQNDSMRHGLLPNG